MKKLQIAFAIAVFALVFGIAENTFAQSPPMVGGFKTVSVKDQGVIAATNFAMKKIGESEEMKLKLVSILKAEQQVVQGVNYKVLFQTTYYDGGEEYELCLTAKVYRNLKNVFTLSNWDSLECPE